MKLSVVIICWNDSNCILDCIRSVQQQTKALDYEIIVTDNASTDRSADLVREAYPNVRIIENETNLGFGGGNNAGFRLVRGDYTLILNPDTLVLDQAIEKLVAFADRHPQAGGVGCRVLNPDRSPQCTTWPLPTLWRSLFEALALGWLIRAVDDALGGRLRGNGRTERRIGFMAGCCLLVRTPLLKALGGFDERFFHQKEDADLCRRIWDSGQAVLYYPGAEIIHIGGRKRGNYPPRVVLEAERSKYRYFHKYLGNSGVACHRYISLIACALRWSVFSVVQLLRPLKPRAERLSLLQLLLRWHWRLDPAEFVTRGVEPDVGCPPLAPASRSGREVAAAPVSR